VSVLAAVLLGASVAVLTTSLWPRRPSPPAPDWRLVEDPRVPRTLH